jgi:hypothetical protein
VLILLMSPFKHLTIFKFFCSFSVFLSNSIVVYSISKLSFFFCLSVTSYFLSLLCYTEFFECKCLHFYVAVLSCILCVCVCVCVCVCTCLILSFHLVFLLFSFPFPPLRTSLLWFSQENTWLALTQLQEALIWFPFLVPWHKRSWSTFKT